MIKKIIKLLNSGAVIILPTDTVYGIFCSAFNKSAVRKIYKIKGRDFSKPLQVFLAGKNQIKQYCDLNNNQIKYINKYLPGPYTLIFNLKDSAKRLFSFLKDTIGIRIIKYGYLKYIIKETGPLAATSANLSGTKTPVLFSDIPQKILKNADFALENNKIIKGKASSIIDLTRDSIKIIRQ